VTNNNNCIIQVHNKYAERNPKIFSMRKGQFVWFGEFTLFHDGQRQRRDESEMNNQRRAYNKSSNL
jgi:hypothetical protein